MGSCVNVVVCKPHFAPLIFLYLPTYIPTYLPYPRETEGSLPVDRGCHHYLPVTLNFLSTHILLNLTHTIFKPNP